MYSPVEPLVATLQFTRLLVTPMVTVLLTLLPKATVTGR